MNKHPSTLDHMDDTRSPSPKRKKIRQKYAPKACVSCRRSKLKCTGENPCQRCVDNGKRCFYSEDQTAAEVLQNLSRPTPTPTSSSQPPFNTGNGVSRRNVMPRHQPAERRASDASVLGMTMESRMARIEAMMEALVQDRGLTFSPSGSIEREESDGFRSESAFSMPILDPIHPALDSMTQQSPEHMLPPPVHNDSTMHVRAGTRMIPFPEPARYQQYVAHFFADVNPRHPCVFEAEFVARAQRVVTDGATETSDVHFLAFCYVIFACCDAIVEMTGQMPSPTNANGKPPGWQWFILADSLIDEKATLNVWDDVVIIYLSLYKALYFMYVDMPMMAYSSIRTACTAALQQNLHQQMTWVEHDAELVYWRLCLFWNVFILDHSISISCGRPVSFRKADVQVEIPDVFCSRVSLPMQEHMKSINQCLNYEILTARMTAVIFSKASKSQIPNNDVELREIQQQMTHISNNVLPHMKLAYPQWRRLSPHRPGSSRILNDFLVPLVVCRKGMTTSTYGDTLKYFVELAVVGWHEVSHVWDVPDGNTHCSCPHQLTSLLAGILLVYGAFVLRDPSADQMLRYRDTYPASIAQFQRAAAVLSALAQTIPYGKRVYEDFSSMIFLINEISAKHQSLRRGGDPNPSWDFVKDMLPPNVNDLIPYQTQSPRFQMPPGFEGDALEGWAEARGRGSGVLWLF